MKSSLSDRLRRVAQRVRSRSFVSEPEPPLLNTEEYAAIERWADQLTTIPWGQQLASDPRFGDVLSPMRGRGYEFDEHRLFAIGDDPRHVNWRLYGRTGLLYSKRFQEERRSTVTLVVDRSRSMWFGTRRRLKVTQAARIACAVAAAAGRFRAALDGVVVESGVRWLQAGNQDADSSSLVSAFCASAELALYTREEATLPEVLRGLAHLPGQERTIVFISDFHDLGEADLGLLRGLAEHNTLYAYRIVDPAERQLPAGDYTLQGSDGTRAFNLSRGGRTLRDDFARRRAEREAEIDHLLVAAGVTVRTVLTEDDHPLLAADIPPL